MIGDVGYIDEGGGLGMDMLPGAMAVHPKLAQLEMSDEARDKIAAAIRDEIKAACSDETFTGEHLHRILQLAAAARPFFASRDPMKHRVGPGFVGQFGGGVLAPSPMTETFGANALRELVEMARKSMNKQNQPSLVDMVKAIADAKAAGLSEIAVKIQDELEARLGSEVETIKAELIDRHEDPDDKAPAPNGSGTEATP